MYTASKSSTNTYDNYYDWLNVWWKSVIKNSLINCKKYFTFIINNKYKDDMRDVCLLPEFNLKFIEEISVNKKTNVNHFHRIPSDKPGSKTKNIKKGEKILVFRKKS